MEIKKPLHQEKWIPGNTEYVNQKSPGNHKAKPQPDLKTQNRKPGNTQIITRKHGNTEKGNQKTKEPVKTGQHVYTDNMEHLGKQQTEITWEL